MSRNSTGTYTLPIAAFIPGGVIKSADHNANYADIATALTQSLATTGVSTMTGPIKAASGTVGAPTISFGAAQTTGFYLAGANQIGWAAAGVAAGTFNANGSVSFGGAATISGNVVISGALDVAGAITTGGSSAPLTAFPSGTRLLFAQAAAPAAWTQVITYDDYALRLVSGAGAGVAGTKGFSTIFNATITNLAAHTHVLTDPGHAHSYTYPTHNGANGGGAALDAIAGANTTGSSSTGISIASYGGGSWITMEIKYLDLILCSRN